jgi:hypothetical protein
MRGRLTDEPTKKYLVPFFFVIGVFFFLRLLLRFEVIVNPIYALQQ